MLSLPAGLVRASEEKVERGEHQREHCRQRPHRIPNRNEAIAQDVLRECVSVLPSVSQARNASLIVSNAREAETETVRGAFVFCLLRTRRSASFDVSRDKRVQPREPKEAVSATIFAGHFTCIVSQLKFVRQPECRTTLIWLS